MSLCETEIYVRSDDTKKKDFITMRNNWQHRHSPMPLVIIKVWRKKEERIAKKEKLFEKKSLMKKSELSCLFCCSFFLLILSLAVDKFTSNYWYQLIRHFRNKISSLFQMLAWCFIGENAKKKKINICMSF